MKIQVLPQDMVRHIAQCQRAISSRTTMQILECIRFEAKNDTLTLHATDLELTIETSFPVQVLEEGVVVIPSTMIGNIFRKLPSAPATLEEKNGVVHIRCLDSSFTLQVPGAGEFPNVPEIDTENVTRLPNDVLSRAIGEVQFATSQDESKVALTGIYYERKKEEIRLVTLDGYRLAVRYLPLAPEEGEWEESMIVPKRALLEYGRMIDEKEQTAIRTVPGHILLETGTLRLYSRLIDKSYINYEEIISNAFKTKVEVNRLALRDAVERASLLAQGERAHLVKLHFTDSVIQLESNSEIGSVQEVVSCTKEGNDLTIAFNARYLLDGIGALSSENLVLYLNGMLNPMVVRPAEEEAGYLYLVLPVRIAGE